ncbi:MAG TPA: type IV conjugative transfer system protein TraE [Alphaproteobacteria bacterium]|nr:type IV conjugative transfer system protein TraE [Alphaproteobacteria bacterium]
MKLRLLNNRLGDLLHQRNLILALGLGLLGLNFTQALFTLFHSERIVVVPPDLKQEIWLEKNRVSASYLEEMALVFADLILESSPASAAYKRDIILRNTVSEGYGPLKTQLLRDEDQLKKDHVTTSFQPNAIKVDAHKLTVELTGDLLRFVGEKRISQSRDRYQFQFEYRVGRLLIKSFELISSNQES